MYVKSIKIINFKNYENQNFEFSPNINIIYGKNAQGKTNLLESIYFLSLGKSHRSISDKDLIKYGYNNLKLKADVIVNDFPKKFVIEINNNKKSYNIYNYNYKSLNDYVSNLKVIIFFPEDLNLVKGSPEDRRRYINIQISQLNKTYFKIMNDYNHLLKIRNDLLKEKLKIGIFNKNYFYFITKYLVNKAGYIYLIRKKYVEKINQLIGNYYKKISKSNKIKIEYIKNIDIEDNDYELIKERLLEKYKKLESAEMQAGLTLIGPHKDDFIFLMNDKDIKKYGSQGQQRMCILALKLSEIEIFKKESNDNPILLLDDVFSELDDEKKNNLLKNVSKNIQTIITTTDLNNIDSKIIKKANLIEIENGMLITRGE